MTWPLKTFCSSPHLHFTQIIFSICTHLNNNYIIVILVCSVTFVFFICLCFCFYVLYMYYSPTFIVLIEISIQLLWEKVRRKGVQRKDRCRYKSDSPTTYPTRFYIYFLPVRSAYLIRNWNLRLGIHEYNIIVFLNSGWIFNSDSELV